MSTLKVNEVRHISNTGTANIVLESNEDTNLQTTSTKGLSVDGTLTVSGVATLNGNTVVGNASTDTMVLTSTVSGFNNFSGFTGEMRMYAGNAAGNSPPAGWLYCNGDTISQTTGNGGNHYNADGKGNDYQSLFNLLKASNDWGNASSAVWGTNTVKTPDFRARTPVGVGTGAANAIGTGSDTAALTVRALGDTTGAENHILVTNEIPAHLHGATSVDSATGISATHAHTHTVPSGTSGTTTPGDGETVTPSIAGTLPTFNLQGSTAVGSAGPGYRTLLNVKDSPPDGGAWRITVPEQTLSLTGGSHEHAGAAHTHTTPGSTTSAISTTTVAITDSGHGHTIATTNTGGGLKHQNLSPIIAVNYIIKV